MVIFGGVYLYIPGAGNNTKVNKLFRHYSTLFYLVNILGHCTEKEMFSRATHF